MSLEADMDANFRLLGLAGALSALGFVANLAGCTTDDGDPGAGTGGSGTSTGGGTGTGGGSAKGTGGASATGTVCESPIMIDPAKPGIADFDTYDGVASLATWSFPLGSDMATGVTAGTFGYGDRATGQPETFELSAGNGTKYAMRIADTLAEKYGGGEGIWLSACLNATKLQGISFWVRGSTPDGKGTLTASMQETVPSTPAKVGDKVGTCTGDAMTCIHPTFVFPVTDTWAQVQVPWASFKAGDAAGTAVTPDGRNITQVQFGVGLVWVADAAGVYAPTPAPYELAVDTLAFY